jgi:enoyl-[acyl-carrier protein] reductase I
MRTMLSSAAERAPLKRNIDTDDVGGSCLYLLSPLAKGVTGEIHYVDAGFSTTAM